MAIEKRWAVKDAKGNILNEFEGIADSSFVGRMFGDAEIAFVQQLDDVVIPDETPTQDAVVRMRRDALLQSSDWTQVAEAPVDQAAWAVYRQALRDIPQQEGFPDDVTWPVQP